MILVLFIVSVVVMELILKDDDKNLRESGRDRIDCASTPAQAEAPLAASITPDLLSLAKAVRPDAVEHDPALVSKAVQNKPEYNREDDRAD